MSGNNATTESGGFTAEERAAMKKRAAELRAEGKKGAKKADGLRPPAEYLFARVRCGDEFQDASWRQVLLVDPYAEG